MISYFTFAATIMIVAVTVGSVKAEEINNTDPALANSPRSTSVNQNFQLNIDSERIIEQDYKSSASILFGEDSPHSISLQIGSVVRAREIDMHLQNIRGQVHFRGTWEPILQNLRSRRGIFETQSK